MATVLDEEASLSNKLTLPASSGVLLGRSMELAIMV
jgi:hypothetical protein